jgi:predicted RNA-binding Zn-ribbon protein involved in translation (DUF1610 family)
LVSGAAVIDPIDGDAAGSEVDRPAVVRTRGSDFMLRMNIRVLMLLVLYSAVALWLFMPAFRAPVKERLIYVAAAMVGVPMVFAGLSWLILRTGPWRDWLVGFFAFSTLLALAGIAVASFMRTGDLVASIIALCGFPLAFFARERLLPGECPSCGRKGLLKATPATHKPGRALNAVAHVCTSCGVVTFARRGGVLRDCPLCGKRLIPDNSSLSAHYLCESCRAVTYSSRGGVAQACLRCGRSRWLDSPVPDRWEYFWCLACGARSKQRVDGRWEAARRPEDDGPYARFDLVGWVKGLVSG